MQTIKSARGAALAIVIALAPASIATAQSVSVPQEAPRTIPGLVIQTPAPQSGATPVPVPTDPVRGLPTPIARASTASRRVASRAERPEALHATAPEADPTSTPQPAVGVTSSPTPAVTAPTPVGSPIAPLPPVPAVPESAADKGFGLWPWIAIVLVGLVAFAAWALVRRGAVPEPVAQPASAATPMPEVSSPVAAPPLAPAGPRARIAIAFRPRRAGLNMLSAVVEGVVVVTNSGDADAGQVQVHTTLLSAHPGQETDLAAAFAAPSGRPAAPPFVLAAGEARSIRFVAALPREAVRSMEAAGRAMFVPLVVVDVCYTAEAEGAAARTGQAFVVGVERADSAKLAPFWLDGPLRMQEQVAARAHGAVVDQ